METYRLGFVRATTADGVPLDGVVFAPDAAPRGDVLLVHGAGSHFYQPLLQTLGATLAAAGYRVLAGNNRGHDLGAYQPNDGPEVVLGGAAWERFADCILDLRAWIDLMAADQGGAPRPVALIGHSLGAAKAARYAATAADPRVAALIGCSGLGFGSRFSRMRPPPEERLAAVRRLVADGRGEQLLDTSFQRRYISARTYLDRYERMLGPEGTAADLARVAIPLLIVYATGEGGTPELLADLQARAASAPRCDAYLVQDADHDYHGQEAVVAARLARWLDIALPR